jgi:hypothetical protein
MKNKRSLYALINDMIRKMKTTSVANQNILYGLMQFPNSNVEYRERFRKISWLCRTRYVLLGQEPEPQSEEKEPLNLPDLCEKGLERLALEVLFTELHFIFAKKNEKLFPNQAAIEWYEEFLNFIEDYGHQDLLFIYQTNGIIPSQDGMTHNFLNCYIDMNLPEECKDLLDAFPTDQKMSIRAKLLPQKLRFKGGKSIDKSQLLKSIEDAALKSLAECSERSENARRRLFRWMMQNEEDAQACMPMIYQKRYAMCDNSVVDEEMKRGRKFQNLMDEFGFEDEKSLENFLECICNPKEECDTGNTMYDGDDLRQIGEWGEQFVFQSIKERIIEQGCKILKEDDGFLRFSTEGSYLEMWLMDDEGYKNQGYDIGIFTAEHEIYSMIEVKSTMSNRIGKPLENISAAQWEMAMQEQAPFYFAIVTGATKDDARLQYCQLTRTVIS